MYHPPETEQNSLRDHLFRSIFLAEATFPNCSLIVAGDFNRLNVKGLQKYFNLTQIVEAPTHKGIILNYVLTNYQWRIQSGAQGARPPFR